MQCTVSMRDNAGSTLARYKPFYGGQVCLLMMIRHRRYTGSTPFSSSITMRFDFDY